MILLILPLLPELSMSQCSLREIPSQLVAFPVGITLTMPFPTDSNFCVIRTSFWLWAFIKKHHSSNNYVKLRSLIHVQFVSCAALFLVYCFNAAGSEIIRLSNNTMWLSTHYRNQNVWKLHHYQYHTGRAAHKRGLYIINVVVEIRVSPLIPCPAFWAVGRTTAWIVQGFFV